MDKAEHLRLLKCELRTLRNRYPRFWQPISGCPGTLAYTAWRDTRARIVTPRMLVVAAIRERGYNPYASNLGWL